MKLIKLKEKNEIQYNSILSFHFIIFKLKIKNIMKVKEIQEIKEKSTEKKIKEESHDEFTGSPTNHSFNLRKVSIFFSW